MGTAAVLALLGLPAERYLTTADPVERAVLVAVAKRADSMLTKAAKRGN